MRTVSSANRGSVPRIEGLRGRSVLYGPNKYEGANDEKSIDRGAVVDPVVGGMRFKLRLGRKYGEGRNTGYSKLRGVIRQ